MTLSTVANVVIAEFLTSRDARFSASMSELCGDLAVAQESGNVELADYIKGSIRELLQPFSEDEEIDRPLVPPKRSARGAARHKRLVAP